MDNIQIRQIGDQKEVSQVISIYKTIYKNQSNIFNEDWFYWKYKSNPSSDKVIFLIGIDSKGRILGAKGFWPLDFLDSKGNRYLGYQCTDSAVIETARGQGLFTRLNNEALKMAKAAGGDFVFQFPNDNSLPGYLKMGWEQDTALVRMIRLPIWHRRETGKWGQYHSSHFSSPFFVVDKNEEYFKWRYVNHPYFKYEIEKLDEKNYVVYRHCIIKKLPVLLLIDFAPSLDSFFRADFGTIQNFLNSVGRGRLVATLSTPVFTSICKWRSLGFTPLFLGRGACMVVKQIKNIDIVSTKIEITPGYFDTY